MQGKEISRGNKILNQNQPEIHIRDKEMIIVCYFMLLSKLRKFSSF